MVASRQHWQHLLLLKNKTANTQEVNSTGWWYTVTCDIGLTLYSSSCGTRYELNLLLGREKMSVEKTQKMSAKKSFVKTPHRGVIRGN
jgi:hypothetical protein